MQWIQAAQDCPKPGRGARVEQVSTRCCIAGGGPAGMMLGYLLARAGVDVQVLEKHAGESIGAC